MRRKAQTRNLALIISGFRVHRSAMPRNDNVPQIGCAIRLLMLRVFHAREARE
jgi:hypothetical protein